MKTSPLGRLAEFKIAITLLKDRERSLRQISQSRLTANLPEAELELARIRDQVQATYAKMRPLNETT